jgi:deoxyribose-phosphate aldolase
MTLNELAKKFDHTLLKATAVEADIRKLCEEARAFRFASVCVNPCWVPLAAELLRGSDVLVCTVIGFPLGANSSALKAHEAAIAVAEGAGEVDMVINVGRALEGRWDLVESDIRQVRQAAGTVVLKVILETCYLSDDQIAKACAAASAAGAVFVKTSTGFGTAGATADHVRLMRKSIKPGMKVKASGGIRTLSDTLDLLEAGADRIGASASVAIVKEFKGEQSAGVPVGY